MNTLSFIIIHGHREGDVFTVADGQPFTVGREKDNSLVILDKSISRRHCTFAWSEGECRVRDHESRNGVLVNEERVTSRALRPGDVVRLGTIVIKADGGASADGTALSAVSPAAAAAAGGPRIRRIAARKEFTHHPDRTVDAFLAAHRHESAVRVITWPQAVWYAAVGLGLFILLNYDWLYFLTLINFVLSAFYIVTILFKLVTVLLAAIRRREVTVDEACLAALDPAGLPVYTVLLPLYREPAVTDKILKAVDRLDYPRERLDVKILLEDDDAETLAACRAHGIPAYCEVLIAPEASPRTKPRACNHGLAAARGEFLVIFDAEDRPEPDQLKKAVCAFRSHPETACFQSKLNYYNQNQNLLTRWFTVEYSAWFDLFLPGLHVQSAPIPLGGTSNHFRTAVLQAAGGWDPFNVTEDADLGIRLSKQGHRTMILDSTTWEEANSRPLNWIRQRSRWIKGYIQTHLVHMRNPFRLMAQLGPRGFLAFLFTVGGMALMMLLNPIYWLFAGIYGGLLTADVMAGRGLWEVLSMPGPGRDYHAWQMLFLSEADARLWSSLSVIFFTAAAVLFVSNFIFIAINLLASRRRRLRGMLLANLLSPFYWLLISVAAWKGFLQLFYKPFYWEKTIHGLADDSME